MWPYALYLVMLQSVTTLSGSLLGPAPLLTPGPAVTRPDPGSATANINLCASRRLRPKEKTPPQARNSEFLW